MDVFDGLSLTGCKIVTVHDRNLSFELSHYTRHAERYDIRNTIHVKYSDFEINHDLERFIPCTAQVTFVEPIPLFGDRLELNLVNPYPIGRPQIIVRKSKIENNIFAGCGDYYEPYTIALYFKQETKIAEKEVEKRKIEEESTHNDDSINILPKAFISDLSPASTSFVPFQPPIPDYGYCPPPYM